MGLLSNALFARAGAAVRSGTKSAGALTLAQQIRRVVMDKIPGAGVVEDLVPEEILDFGISFTVAGLAQHFSVPGRERVLDTAQHAMQGAAHEASRVILRFVEPVVAEILRLNPEGAPELPENDEGTE